jgi:threonylcarbamoyladenosine tRNA methylthiotransferase MtaB
MRIYLESLGCRLNYAEMISLGRQLAAAGHELVAAVADADLCVLNSCTVTAEAARQSRQLARRLARMNPAVRLIVTGCYATLEGETVAQLPNVALVVGNRRKDDLLALIQDYDENQMANSEWQMADSRWQMADSRWQIADSNRSPSAINHQPSAIGHQPSAISQRTRAFVKVQDGCRNRCTFCIVTVARGDERSRPIGEVVAEVNALHAEGYQEAVLTGVHLGGYGSDVGADLRSLIAALLAETSIPRLRLSSLEPFDLLPDFFDLWGKSDGRLMPHLHLPAQSGSDAVLRRMARRNRAVDFEALVAAARAAIPGLTITTDLIAGFPGETEDDFAQTIAFARRVGFAHLHVFPYSPREGTAAAQFAGQVPAAERKRRSRILIDLDAELGAAVRASFVGRTRSVLWENDHLTPSAPPSLAGKGDGGIGPIWSGLTDNYLRVLTAAPTAVDLHNRITLTRLARVEEDALWGEITSS